MQRDQNLEAFMEGDEDDELSGLDESISARGVLRIRQIEVLYVFTPLYVHSKCDTYLTLLFLGSLQVHVESDDEDPFKDIDEPAPGEGGATVPKSTFQQRYGEQIPQLLRKLVPSSGAEEIKEACRLLVCD